MWTAVRRGLSLRCPACGGGKILSGYLRQADACSACGLRTGLIRADDGPAWATILLVGHLVSPAFFMFTTRHAVPWLPFALVAGLVIALSLILLPRMKGLFIGVSWATRAAEADVLEDPLA